MKHKSEEASLLDRDVEPSDRHRRKAERAGDDEALATADDGRVFSTRADRLDEAELGEAPARGAAVLR